MICDICGCGSCIIYSTRDGEICDSCYKNLKNEIEDKHIIEAMYKRYGLIKDKKGEWSYE